MSHEDVTRLWLVTRIFFTVAAIISAAIIVHHHHWGI